MPFNVEAVRNWQFEPIRRRWDARDTILYALGLGIGQNPLDERELRYVYGPELSALPTLALVLGHPGSWLADRATGVDYGKVVQGDIQIEFLNAFPSEGEVLCANRVEEVVDKGEGKAAIVTVSKEICDSAGGSLVARQRSTLFLRGHGGFGGAPESRFETPLPPPAGKPDETFTWLTPQNLALLYRLSGDMNPLHADPALAHRAGFDRPILHGFATFGILGYAALRCLCDNDPGRLKALGARFAAPVYPGETLEFEFRRRGSGGAAVSARVVERDIAVLANGFVRWVA
jgi:acyl dehydratase